MKNDNKSLYESIMNAIAKEVKKALNEGAGAGYDVTIKGLYVKDVKILKSEQKGKDVIIKFQAKLKGSHVEWKAVDYYNGVDSRGIFIDGELVEEFDDLQRSVNGGEIYGYVYEQDVADYTGNDEVGYEEIQTYINEHLDDFEFTTMYGGGWVHSNLTDPMVFENIEVSYQNRGYECVFIDKIIINAPEITKTINWFFENCNNLEEIYFGNEDEE